MSVDIANSRPAGGGSLDRNAAFAAERRTQLDEARNAEESLRARLEAGTLVPLGGNRYRISDPNSWDDGEVVEIRGRRIIAEHGLDLTSGSAALYTAVPAWHGLGTVVPGGISDVTRVLQLGRVDFDVLKVPALYQTDPDDATRVGVVPGRFATVRSDTRAALGVVGEDYTPLQNRDLFEFLQDVVEDDAAVFESAGALREGRRVFVTLRLPESIRVDAGGINDEIRRYLVALNSHDGTSSASLVVTPWRVECGNTERFAMRDAVTRWAIRHTSGARWRLEEARRTLQLSNAYYQAFAAEEETLARTQLDIDEFQKVLDEVWQAPDANATTRALTNYRRRVNTLTELYETNSATLGATGYAAERAISEYTDWYSGIRPTGVLKGNRLGARATAALEGTHDTVKNTAHQRLMARTTR